MKKYFGLILTIIGLVMIARCGKDDSHPVPPAPSGKTSVLIGTPAQKETTYKWSPADSVSDPTSAQTWAFPKKTTVYHLEATTKCGTAKSQTTVRVYKKENGELVEQK